MKLKMIFAACALVTTSAFAGGGPLMFVGPTASFNSSSTTTNVNDVYTFSIASTFLANGSLTSAKLKGSDFDVTSIIVSDGTTSYNFFQQLPDPFEYWTLPDVTLTAGSYTLTVLGKTNDKTGSYGANFNLVAAPVPEPETYALMLAGLGALGFIARRRKPQA